MLVHSEAQEQGDGLVMHLALTGDGLFLQNVQPASVLMPAHDQEQPELKAVLEDMRQHVQTGALSKVGMSLEQCQRLMGHRCLIDAVYTPVLPLSRRYKEQLSAPIDRVFVLRAGTVHKQPDGRMADVQVRYVPHESGAALAGDPLVIAANHGYHDDPPLLPAPTVDDGSLQAEQAWAYYCELDWQRTEAPPVGRRAAAASRTSTRSAWRAPGKRPTARSSWSVCASTLQPSARGTTRPSSAQRRRPRSLRRSSASARPRDGETDLLPYIGKALAGEPLDAAAMEGLSELSLAKIEAAVWLRHRFQLVDPDLRDFFYGPHDHTDLLPIKEPSGEIIWPMSDVDKANLDLVHR